jgi:DNA-binding NarL/FixJ family response regulator
MTLVCDARVLLVSDHRLVAETVAAALRGRGVETERLGCATRPGTAAEAEVGLVLSGLDQTIGVGEVRSLVLELPIPWIVVTTASRGAWGAVLEALTVLDRTTSIDDVVATIAGARTGRFSIDADLRRRLERDQRAAADELELLGDHLSRFTPSERSLLRPTCDELADGEAPDAAARVSAPSCPQI